MKKAIIVLSLCILVFNFSPKIVNGHQDLEIGKEFTDILKKGEFPSEKLRPYYETFREPIKDYLKEMREKADWKE